MPRLPISGDYPPDWDEIALATKERADWRCIRCNHIHEVETGYVLTVHHFDGDKSNCEWWNLLALCQRCHLSFQARVNPHVPYMYEHNDWVKVYVAGFYAVKYLNQHLTHDEVKPRIDELVALERVT